MDLIEALKAWEAMGNTTESGDDEQGNYTISFLNKEGEVRGWFKVYAGQGMRWNYPEEIFETAW